MNFTLDDIKTALGITGDYQDATLQIYFDEVIAFLTDAGVPKSNITSGIVARGVSDLWNYGSGDGKLSQYFVQRAIQLTRFNSSTSASSGGGGGGSSPDLSNYYTKMETDALLFLKANVEDVPSKVSDLSNDTGFVTNTVNNLINYYLKTDTYAKSEVNNLIAQIQTAHFEIVEALPATAESNVIYLLPRQNPESENIYDEYVYIGNAYEKIGSTEVDITGFATESWVQSQISDFLTQTQIESLINSSVSVKGISTAGTALTPDINGNVDIPAADGNGNIGVVKTNIAYFSGLQISNDGLISVYPVNELSYRLHAGKHVVTSDTTDLAVRHAMCDGIGAAWTDAERLAALLRMGCTVDDDGFVKFNPQT